jgi:hypothetical protein
LVYQPNNSSIDAREPVAKKSEQLFRAGWFLKRFEGQMGLGTALRRL